MSQSRQQSRTVRKTASLAVIHFAIPRRFDKLILLVRS